MSSLQKMFAEHETTRYNLTQYFWKVLDTVVQDINFDVKRIQDFS